MLEYRAPASVGAAVVDCMDEPAADLIVSADTLVYFGVLDDAIEAAARELRTGGYLLCILGFRPP